MTSMQEGFVSTPTFGRLHYLEAGSGTPLILLHSNGGSAHEFAGVIDGLAGLCRAVAWDMPGHGDSDPVGRHHSIEMYADAVVEFMDAVGVGAANILGVSVGGSICASLGQRYPSRALGLSIVETPLRSSADWRDRWHTVEQTFGCASQTREQIAPRFRSVDADLLARWNLDREKAGVRTMIDVMWAMREFDAASALTSISSPTLLVFGDKGPAIATTGEYRRLRPDMAQIILNDCGHFPMIDDPESFTKAVAVLLATR